MAGFARHQERHVANARAQVVTDVAVPDHPVDGFLNVPLVSSVDVRVGGMPAGSQFDAAHRARLNRHYLVLDQRAV